MKTNPDKKNISSFDYLKDSEEKYRLLVENLNDAIVISHNDKFIYFNTQFADLLGYDPEELMLKDYREIYSKKSINILKKRQTNEIVVRRYLRVTRLFFSKRMEKKS